MNKPTQQRVKQPIQLVNHTSIDIPPYAALEVVQLETARACVSVRRPTADGLTMVVFNLGAVIRANGGTGFGAVNWPVKVQYDNAAGDPATGEAWGTQAGSYKLAKGKFGCRAIAGAMSSKFALFFPETTCIAATAYLSASYPIIGSGFCCGCRRFDCAKIGSVVFPNLYGVLTTTFMGTMTIGSGTPPIILQNPSKYQCAGQDAVHPYYVYSSGGVLLPQYGFITSPCDGGFPAIRLSTIDDVRGVQLNCLDPGSVGGVGSIAQCDGRGIWYTETLWFKKIGGILYSIQVCGFLNLVSCSPFYLLGTATVQCGPLISDPMCITSPGLKAFTDQTYGIGTSVQLEFFE